MKCTGVPRRDFLKTVGAGLTGLSLSSVSFGGCGPGRGESHGPARPNFVFLLVDDLGRADLGSFGSRFYETPNVDRLAACGVRFTNAYAASPVCSPTRASILTPMDREIGRLLELLRELGLEEDTLVLFTSDNGPTFNGGTDSEFFRSAGPLRGLKTEHYEGGIRVPLVARWPGRIPAGSVAEFPWAFWDFLPTVAELTDQALPGPSDGVSILPTLLGDPGRQVTRPYRYWEFQGRQALRMSKWKAYRDARTESELFPLAPSEAP